MNARLIQAHDQKTQWLEVLRGDNWLAQHCPFTGGAEPMHCGDWCPLFNIHNCGEYDAVELYCANLYRSFILVK